jgi:anaerobic ribonucleoside-triphosphate reductase activating protein
MLPFEGGQLTPLTDVLEQLRRAAEEQGVEGITVLGGEPIAHAARAAALARETRALGLSVMVFSGHTLDEIHRMTDSAVADLLARTDILVDGPYIRELPETKRRWIGSSNQVIHFLTNRYRADDPCWQTRNTQEIRLENGELVVNGFPTPLAVSRSHSVLRARNSKQDRETTMT